MALTTIYALGLRIGEGFALEAGDLDRSSTRPGPNHFGLKNCEISAAVRLTISSGQRAILLQAFEEARSAPEHACQQHW